MSRRDAPSDRMLFALKKLVGSLAEPLSVALVLALAALLLFALRRRRAAAWVGGTGAVFVYLCATPAVGQLLCAPLEHRFAPLREEEVPPGIGFVVVLG